MIKSFLLAVVMVISFSGCLKDEEPKQNCEYDACAFKAPASEILEVENYLASNNITNAVQHCSGAYYIIENEGTGSIPNVCSFINANYVGKLTNGTIFDQGTFQQPLQLGQLVRGWVNTIPLIKKGGKMRMFLPPSLGYGNQANGPIPANSILIFDLELTFVQ